MHIVCISWKLKCSKRIFTDDNNAPVLGVLRRPLCSKRIGQRRQRRRHAGNRDRFVREAKTRKPTTVLQRTFVLGKAWEETEYRFEVGHVICGGQKNSVRDALSASACIGLNYCQYLIDFDVFKRSSMPITQKIPCSHYKYKLILLTHIITHDSEPYEIGKK